MLRTTYKSPKNIVTLDNIESVLARKKLYFLWQTQIVGCLKNNLYPMRKNLLASSLD